MTVPPGQHSEPESGPDQRPCCVRHPERPTGLLCVRCDRPACPECLREADVGYQCVDCFGAGQRGRREPVTVAGAKLSTSGPIVVPTLIALNVIVYLVTAVQAGSPMAPEQSALFRSWVMWPPGVAGGQWWRIITSGFIHLGLIHLLVNMLALWIIGQQLELVLGRLRFIAVYMLSLLGGSAAIFLFAFNVSVGGASGALYGLIGGIAVAAYRLKLNLRPILLIIGLNIALTISFGFSLLGHLGGLVLGTVATAALLYAPKKNRNLWQAGTLGALLVALILVFVTRDALLGNVVCLNTPSGARCGIMPG